ncbi:MULTISPECIES: hypothetical protein [Flavobacteriaceae]|uniref:hypothetical protein n=1 Tax=Flavobacteriaceae TaxID=49546 RepID=UPI0011C9C67D|nr:MULTISPECIES: hypothetical protein [Flavobacteriaceae]
MKINKPPKVFLGHLYLEYTGNNLVYINTNDVSAFQDIHFLEFFLVNSEIRVVCCFKIDLLGVKCLIDFATLSIYKYDNATKEYKYDDYSLISEYFPHTNRDITMIAGKLQLYNPISATDGRNETFNFNLVFDKKEEIINLFKY